MRDSECPSIEELERGGAFVSRHLTDCFLCQAELELIREFLLARVEPEEEMPVKHITLQLTKARIRVRKLSMLRVWAAAACLIMAIASAYLLRIGEPAITEGPGVVMRSQQLQLKERAGNVLRWEILHGAASYRVKVMEVDRTVVWECLVKNPYVEIPADVLARMLPGKTLLWEITANDGSGRIVASSGVQELR